MNYCARCAGEVKWFNMRRWSEMVQDIQVKWNGARCTGEVKWCKLYRWSEMVQDVQVKWNPELQRQKHSSRTRKILFTNKIDFNLRNRLTQRYCGAQLGIVLKCGQLGNWIRSNLKVRICGAVEGWRRPVGPIMWEMEKCCIELRGEGYTA